MTSHAERKSLLVVLAVLVVLVVLAVSTKFAYPRLDNYYGDYTQLAFSFEPQGGYRGIYTYTEDEYGGVVSQFMAINLSKYLDYSFEEFIEKFCRVWLHEYLHIVGITDEGINIISRLGFPVDRNKT